MCCGLAARRRRPRQQRISEVNRETFYNLLVKILTSENGECASPATVRACVQQPRPSADPNQVRVRRLGLIRNLLSLRRSAALQCRPVHIMLPGPESTEQPSAAR
jgi:hypothetical protein